MRRPTRVADGRETDPRAVHLVGDALWRMRAGQPMRVGQMIEHERDLDGVAGTDVCLRTSIPELVEVRTPLGA